MVPCHNEARYVGATLRSLTGQSYRGGHEIIVVDNNCTDDTATIAAGFGVRIVAEPTPGVCAARQAGTSVARAPIVVSADADTLYGPDWLARIAEQFDRVPEAVAVVGPCRYADGPLWGRLYARTLFGLVGLLYRLTGRTLYVTATNIAFRREHFTGYNQNLPQGGDELDVLRRMRRRGRVIFDATNPSHSSGRRLSRGFAYSVFVTLLVHYLLAYGLNRLCQRQVLGAAPAFRDNARPAVTRVRMAAVSAALAVTLLLVPFTTPRRYVSHASHTLVGYLHSAMTGVHL